MTPVNPSPPPPADRPAPASPVGPPTRGGPTDPSHDQELRRGILHTQVDRRVAALLVAVFLAIICAVPIAQAALERFKGDASVLPELFGRWPTQDSIKQFEEDLEKASYAREGVRPRLQSVLTRFGKFGNSKAVVGRDDWLFYQPGIVAVGGPPFLDADILDSRAKVARDAGAEPLYPDPRPAILDFHAYLQRRGIRLVVFPVPDKAGLQPRELHGRTGNDEPLVAGRNADHGRLVGELERAGVLVFDPTPARLDPRHPPRFLKQDTHWTPAWMTEVASALAGYVRQHAHLQPAAGSHALWKTTPRSVARLGDVVDMLGLPADQTLFTAQAVTVLEVHDAAGLPFEPDQRAPVLLLGDSFSNVFTLGQMGWGESAGLAAQLARFLDSPVDVIAQNDSGAFATRRLLRNEVGQPPDAREGPPGSASGSAPDRLTGKKVVIWEFASRELAVGNWKPLAWPSQPGKAPVSGAAPGGTEAARP